MSGFKAEERDVFFPHYLFHIGPGSERSLSKDIRLSVQKVVEYGNCNVGHTDFVGIREDKNGFNKGIVPVLDYGIPFAAGIAGGFFYAVEYGIEFIYQQIFFPRVTLYLKAGVEVSKEREQLVI